MRQDEYYALLIAKIEESLGVSLSELSSRIGISKSSLYSYAKAERTPSTKNRKLLINYASSIGVDPDLDFFSMFSKLTNEDKNIIRRMIESLYLKEEKDKEK